MSAPVPDWPSAVRSGPVVLVVGEDFDSLLGPLRWLADAGYDVRACLGPLAADRTCGLFEGGCPELDACAILVTNERPHRLRKLLGPRRELVQQARLRREELPILVVDPAPGEVESAAYAASARVVAPKRNHVLKAVFELAGAPTVGAPPGSSTEGTETQGDDDG